MTSPNIESACSQLGLTPICYNVNYTNDGCVLAGVGGNFHSFLANEFGCEEAGNCEELLGVYLHMGNRWQGEAACGIEPGEWCSDGRDYANRFTVCGER